MQFFCRSNEQLLAVINFCKKTLSCLIVPLIRLCLMLTITEKHLGKITSEIRLALARNILSSFLNEMVLTSQMIKRDENYLILATTLNISLY